ncbi:MAG: ParB N-terminal domain-containing protein [Candidatus Micrarchaeota archaeon]|nr:ParB N-terminal domain-containing protein [Candidatus Micrarchaeota archaeon]
MRRKNVKPQIIEKVGFDFNWSEKKVWKLKIPESSMPIKSLEWHFDIPFWDKQDGCYDLTPKQVLAKPMLYSAEYRRIMHADLRHPIDVMRNKRRWLILDGLHRLVKAKTLGMSYVKVRKIPRSAIPKILV